MSEKVIPVFSNVPKLKGNRIKLKPKQAIALPFKEQWPKILAWMVENPKAKPREIYAFWQDKLDDIHSIQAFRRKLADAGMMPSQVKQGLSVKAQVSTAIKSFHEVKKQRAEKHMQRIHKSLEKIHKVVGKISVTEKNVGAALDLVSRLHKEGRLAYDIDQDNQGDKKVTNLALLIGMVPQQGQIDPVDSAKTVPIREI